MARFISTLSLLLLLLAAPVLCAGGFLEHACECGETVTCGHEDSCPDDPCVTVIRVEDQDWQAIFDFEGPKFEVGVCALNAKKASAFCGWSSRPPLPPDRWNMPYAQSDQPLLI